MPKTKGAQLNINVNDGGKVINQFFLNSQEANAAQNKIKSALEDLQAVDEHIQKRRVMTWYQVKFDTESDTGDKAIIESISKRAVKVVFFNNAIKDAILHGDRRFSRPWNELAYIVDVEVQTIQGIPKVYTIHRCYLDETFDPYE